MEFSPLCCPHPFPPLLAPVAVLSAHSVLHRNAICLDVQRRWSRLFLTLVLGSGLLVGWVSTGRADTVDFDTQIRPLLSNHCFHCHGPDEATREAGLRLDTQEGGREDLGGYAAIVPGDVSASEAMERINSDDPDLVMPPPDAKRDLSADQKQLLADWVKQGANWSEHWAFEPVAAVKPPQVNSDWARHPIDQFIFKRMQQHGLQPNAEAEPAALIRRVTMDLTGLPPTPEQVKAFVANPSDEAYQQLVDRLLDSPSYGQRMAWDWLDAARYADTDGFQGDPTRTMWPWRDWLINALNDNQPFDQFTIEMLAGDLLPNATQEQILASGFNRNHMFNGEGGRIAEETRVENVFDRTETTSTVWLGLTMTCSRCHDHKYDPISQKEYYQLYDFFNHTSENGRSGRGKTAPVFNYLSAANRVQRDALQVQLNAVQAKLRQPLAALDQAQQVWATERRDQLGAKGKPIQLGPWWKLGTIPAEGKLAYDQDLGPEAWGRETRFDLESAIGKLKWSKQDKQQDGKVLELPATVGATYFYRTLTADEQTVVQLFFGSDDAIKVFFNGQQVLSNNASRAAAADQENVKLTIPKGESHLLIKIVNTGGIGGFFFRKGQESLLGLSGELVKVLSKDPGKRSAAEKLQLQDHYRQQHWDQWAALDKQREALQKQINQVNSQQVTVMVMDDLAEGKRRQTKILERGGYDKPTEVTVQSATPSFLPEMDLPDGAAASRLDLAKWLVRKDHPLTARVTVNRYWQTFFGKGIVASTEDFGSQGQRPTHPQLLDWLATEFMNSGWNVKQLHRHIVTSATYRQSAKVVAATQTLDPQNTFYSRSPRYRWPSWMLRDQALAVSGLINADLGGPSVKSYQPQGIWAEATFGKIRYSPDSGDKLYRRSLYLFWRRIVGPTMFFDGPKRQTCEVKPTRTNTPLHALVTMNETTFVESARQMAQRVMQQHSEVETRLSYAFQLATSRAPSGEELQLLQRRIAAAEKQFNASPEDAVALLSVGASQRNEELDAAQHAAYTVVCLTLLNLDETLTRN
ncbi:MAG: hypothetical protein CBB71_20040 [Rhodopirellula sp. TMED11]|nr:MAG: hypothetical protein CBB71_20040 [Rhodopirellula sp. TMED11]